MQFCSFFTIHFTVLDGRAPGIAIRHGFETFRLLPSLAGVGLTAEAVHGDGKRGMRLVGDGAKGHCTGREPLDDFLRGFHFIERDRLQREIELKQAAQGQQAFVLLID